jgi:ABC-type xylose transport system substrate-binding protein
VDTIGADEREENEALYDIEVTGQDAEVGRILRVINEQADMKSFARAWEKEIAPSVVNLSKEHQRQVEEAKERKKKELSKEKK